MLGRGGYNPWTVARYWTELWGRLSSQDIPAALPRSAHEILRGLRCDLLDYEDVRADGFTTLADEPHEGVVRHEIGALADHALASVNEALGQPGATYTAFERVPVS